MNRAVGPGASRRRRPIRTAVIGFGVAGKVFHAPFIADSPDFSLEAIVTGNPARQRSVAELYPDARLLGNPDELVAIADDLDLVVIASPPRSHAQLAHRALDAGLAVVVDKPFCVTSDEGRELVEKADQLGIPLTVFQNRRWDGDFLTVRDVLESGSLGAVNRFESRFEWWKPERTSGWKDTTPVTEGGGILYDLGPHLIDQAISLFGGVHDVYAEIGTRRAGGIADDDAFVSLAHTCGARSQLWMSSVAAQKGPRFRVLGSDAAYTSWGLDPQEDALREGVSPSAENFGETAEERWGRLGVDPIAHRVPMRPGRYSDFYRLLGEALLTGGPVPVDPRDAVHAIEIIEEIRLSQPGKE